MILKIRNTTDLQEIYNSEVTDKGTSGSYYTFDITLPEDIVDGEYEYILSDNDDVLSTGIITIQGKDTYPKEQYNKPITYEQYETE